MSAPNTQSSMLAFGAGAALTAGALYLFGCPKSSGGKGKCCPSRPAEVADSLVDSEEYNDKEKIVARFVSEFDKLADGFVAFARNEYSMGDDACDRLHRMLHYTCIGGKYNRGVGVLNTVRDICKERGLNFGKRVLPAIVLGWCIEALQAAFLVSDDVMDGSTTRRGQPCWYLVPDVQLDAINDALILESFIYFMLKQHFAGTPEYVSLMELFHDVSFQTQMGQMLDLRAQPQGRKGPEVLAGFNLTLYKQIVHYKTAFYTFYLPYASGMILCGMTGKRELKVAYDLSVELGEKFQIEDDFLDCYGEPEKIGKVGTDILDHKCSWLLVQALLRVSPEQHAVIAANLGKEEEGCEQAVKDLYKELNLEEVYLQQEQDSYDRIRALVEQNKEIIPSGVFLNMLEKIHLREK